MMIEFLTEEQLDEVVGGEGDAVSGDDVIDFWDWLKNGRKVD
jgi:hypothetical protein